MMFDGRDLTRSPRHRRRPPPLDTKRSTPEAPDAEAVGRVLADSPVGFVWGQVRRDNGGVADVTFLAVNEAFERQTGLKDVRGRNLKEIMPAIKPDVSALEAFGRVVATGRSERFDAFFAPLKAWFTISVSRCGADQFLALFDDITDSKLAENRLRESETRLREVLENALDASYKRDLLADRYEYLSPVIEAITGYKAEEVKHLPMSFILENVHPDDRPAVEAVREGARDDVGGGAGQVDYRVRRKDGRYVWLRDRFKVMHDSNGKPEAVIGSVADIDDQKRLESALRESEANLRAVLDASEEEMFLWSADGTLLTLNQVAACRMGGRVGDIVGRNVEDLLSAESRELGTPPITRALASGQRVRFEDERQGRWMANTAQPIVDGEGRVVRLAVYSRDLTELKQAEKRLEAEQDALRESERRYRTLAAENAALAAQAERHAELKAALLDDMNHRVKNGLSLILSIINIETRRSGSRQRRLRSVLLGLEARIASLAVVHNLLTSGEPGPLPLVIVVETVIRSALAAGTPRLDVRLDMTSDDYAKATMLPAQRAAALALVLNELTINSVKHAWPRGGRGRLRVSVSTRRDPAPAWCVEFSDNGVGWPADVLDGHREGVGLRLVRLAAQSPLDAAVVLAQGAPGASVELIIRKSGAGTGPRGPA
jgi:PAS domain S-box-containing protein